MSVTRKQFTFYSSFWEAVKPLNKAQRGAILEAVIRYALDGELTPLSGVAASMFALIKPTLDAGKRKAESGKLGGESKQNASKPQANEKQNASEKEVEKEGEIEGEIEVEIEKENECYIPPNPPSGGIVPAKSPAAKFQKPTVEEIAAYCRERGNDINPEAFYSHYESNGWKVGRNAMKDWKRAVITWENSDIKGGRIIPKNEVPCSVPNEDETEKMRRFIESMGG